MAGPKQIPRRFAPRDDNLPVVCFEIVVPVPTLRIAYANHRCVSVVRRRLLGDVDASSTRVLRDHELCVAVRHITNGAALVANQTAAEHALVNPSTLQTDLDLAIDIAGPTQRRAVSVAAVAVVPAAIRPIAWIDA